MFTFAKAGTAAGEPILVAARDLPTGTALGPRDVRSIAVSPGMRPAGVYTAAQEVADRVLVIPVPAGAPLFPALLSDGDLAANTPAGLVVVPIHLDRTAAELLRPGDHIDLLLPDSWELLSTSTEPSYLARRALVLPAWQRLPPSNDKPGLLGSPTSNREPAILVAVTEQEAPGLSTVALSGTLAAILVP